MGMRRVALMAAVLVLLLVLGAPAGLQACESCSDESTCLPTWTGATECTWAERCRIVVFDGHGVEVCWYVCKQTDYSCVVKPDGPPSV